VSTQVSDISDTTIVGEVVGHTTTSEGAAEFVVSLDVPGKWCLHTTADKLVLGRKGEYGVRWAAVEGDGTAGAGLGSIGINWIIAASGIAAGEGEAVLTPREGIDGERTRAREGGGGIGVGTHSFHLEDIALGESSKAGNGSVVGDGGETVVCWADNGGAERVGCAGYGERAGHGGKRPGGSGSAPAPEIYVSRWGIEWYRRIRVCWINPAGVDPVEEVTIDSLVVRHSELIRARVDVIVGADMTIPGSWITKR